MTETNLAVNALRTGHSVNFWVTGRSLNRAADADGLLPTVHRLATNLRTNTHTMPTS